MLSEIYAIYPAVISWRIRERMGAEDA